MYLLVVLAILCATINNALLHMLSQKNGKYNAYLFNAAISVIWAIGLSIWNQGWHDVTETTLLYGALYGLALTGFIFFKMKAMESGPIALTALIGCSSFVITTLFNAIYWKEQVGVFEILGISLMLVSVFTINYPSKMHQSQQQKISLQWKIYCALFFVFSAIFGIIFRMHQSFDKVHTDEMMIAASVISACVFVAMFVFTNIVKKCKKRDCGEDRTAEKKNSKNLFLIVLGSGVFSCIYNRLNIFNAGVLPSTVFFPLFNGGVVLGSFFVGLLFKEKPTKIQITGVIIGLLAIATISRFFGCV